VLGYYCIRWVAVVAWKYPMAYEEGGQEERRGRKLLGLFI
jgi:hypothetical protein